MWIRSDKNTITVQNTEVQTPQIQQAPVDVPIIVPGTADVPAANIYTATTVQYGDQTPEPIDGDEYFQPYASYLAEATFRSDPSFDIVWDGTVKHDNPPDGNYAQLSVAQ